MVETFDISEDAIKTLDRYKFLIACVCVFMLLIGAILLVILLPLSYTYINYDEMGFKKDTVSNTIYYDTVYTKGRYFWSPSFVAILFPTTAQYVNYEDNADGILSVFSDTGVEFHIGASFQYFLVKDGLKELYKLYGTNFHKQIVNIGRASMKNAASKMSIEDFLSKRDEVYDHMYEILRDDLNSICGKEKCVDVPPYKFQLKEIKFPNQIEAKYLSIAVQLQNNVREQQIQRAIIIRKETDKLVSQYNANKTITLQLANAESNLAVQNAVAEAFRITQTAVGTGMQYIFYELNIIDSQLKGEFMKLVSIIDGNNPRIISDVSLNEYVSIL